MVPIPRTFVKICNEVIRKYGGIVMSEDYIVRNCAPTLAGIKTGSMFTCPFESEAALRESIRDINRKLGSKGLRALPLRIKEKRALIYLYRPKGLSRDLANDTASALLAKQGYKLSSCESCVAQLIRRIRQQEDFPHEVGLFLGYPPEDVCGFIENKACGCKCVGCWKVYGDEAAAQRRFAQYKKCTRVYCDQWAKGKAIERLTVAG